MINNRVIILAVVFITISFICLGCGNKPDEKQVVAKVNDYVMTVADLKEEISNAPITAQKAQNLDEILDLAIKKQILIQEAQKQGLHLKKDFMKTIQRYWEQTLIRELLRKESEEVCAKGIPQDLRDKTLDNSLNEIYNKADVKVYKRSLKSLE